MPKVALVLAGCGARDGAEITEAVSLLIALSQQGLETHIFAPDRLSHHTVNHLTGAESGEGRNMLLEAARIARGRVEPLPKLKDSSFDGLLFSGGFGVAKNLCNFALEGKSAKLQGDVTEVLIPFLRSGKPVGALCIAPLVLALGARELGWKDFQLTLGDGTASDAIAALEGWGGSHVPCLSGRACVDTRHRLVSAPAYMIANATPADIFSCAQALVGGLLQLLK